VDGHASAVRYDSACPCLQGPERALSPGPDSAGSLLRSTGIPIGDTETPGCVLRDVRFGPRISPSFSLTPPRVIIEWIYGENTDHVDGQSVDSKVRDSPEVPERAVHRHAQDRTVEVSRPFPTHRHALTEERGFPARADAWAGLSDDSLIFTSP